MAFSNGLAAGLQAGINLGNSINDRRDKKKRQVIDDNRYQQEWDRRSELDTEQSKARGLQMGLNQQTLDSNKKKSGVDFAVDVLNDFRVNGVSAVSRLFKDTKRGNELMQRFGYDEIEVQKSDENEYYILGKKGKDWGIVLEDGTLAAEDAAPNPLTNAGVINVGKHLLDVDNETFIAANSIVQKEIAAAKISKEDRDIKRSTAKKKTKDGKVDVAVLKGGKETKRSELRARYGIYKKEMLEKGKDADAYEVWANRLLEPESEYQTMPEPPMTEEDADAEVDAWYNENASMWKSDKSQFGGLNEKQARAKKKAELMGRPVPAIEKTKKNWRTGKVESKPKSQNFSGLWD